jgi:hypothetical protein
MPAPLGTKEMDENGGKVQNEISAPIVLTGLKPESASYVYVELLPESTERRKRRICESPHRNAAMGTAMMNHQPRGENQEAYLTLLAKAKASR